MTFYANSILETKVEYFMYEFIRRVFWIQEFKYSKDEFYKTNLNKTTAYSYNSIVFGVNSKQ